MPDISDFRSADGTSAWEFATLDGTAALRFIAGIAAMRLDGEGLTPDGCSYVVENDHAWETYHDLVQNARSLLGWGAGRPPLDHADYQDYEDEEESDENEGTATD